MRRMRVMWMGLIAASAMLAACQSEEPRVGRDGNVQFSIGALTVPGPADTATYKVTVEVLTESGGGTSFTTFQEFEVTAGSGSNGSTQFVGTCQASDDGTPIAHRATIELVSAEDADGNSLLDGCEGERIQQRYFDCIDGGDSPVAAEFHLMCDIARGFADFTFELDNVYCQTKLDCPTEPLLYDTAIGARVRTLVLGATCSTDLASATDFEIPVFVKLTCDDASGIPSEQGGQGDVDVTKNERFFSENYQGEDVDGIKFNNFAYSLSPEAFDGASKCTFEATVWPEELDAAGAFTSSLRRDAAVVKMSAVLTVSADDVQCSEITVDTEVVSLLELEALQGGTAIQALSYDLAQHTVYKDICYNEYRDDTEGVLGWKSLRKNALELQAAIKKDTSEKLQLEAELEALAAKRKVQNETYNQDVNFLQEGQAGLEADRIQFEAFKQNYIGNTQENMQTSNRLCDEINGLKADFVGGLATNADVKAGLTQYRQIQLAKVIGEFNALEEVVAQSDARYAELVTKFGSAALQAVEPYRAAQASFGKLRTEFLALEDALTRNQLDGQGVIDALTGLIAQCGEPGDSVTKVINAIATMSDAFQDTRKAVDEAEAEAVRKFLETKDSIDNEIMTLDAEISQNKKDAQKFIKDAQARYDEMTVNCDSRMTSLAVRSGFYDLNKRSVINQQAFYFGSEFPANEDSRYIDTCQADGERLNVFRTKDDFHSITTFRDGEAIKAIAVAGEWPADQVRDGQQTCGSAYEAYAGDVGDRSSNEGYNSLPSQPIPQ